MGNGSRHDEPNPKSLETRALPKYVILPLLTRTVHKLALHSLGVSSVFLAPANDNLSTPILHEKREPGVPL